MSGPDVRHTFSRAGVSFVLHLKDRERPLYGDVARAFRESDQTFDLDVWGVGLRTFAIENVRSASAPDLTRAEYIAIRARQAADEPAREERATPGEEQRFAQLDSLPPEEMPARVAEEPAPVPERGGQILPPSPRGGCDDF